MDTFLEPNAEPAPSANVQDAYRALVAEVSQLRRAKRSIEAKLEKAEAARELLRELLSIEMKEEADSKAEETGKQRKPGKRKGFHAGSQTSEVVSRSKKILLAAGRPLQRTELLSKLEASGLLIEAKDPARFVGRTLWESEDFLHIPKRGYWLQGEEVPDELE